ncbi:hypothetical protein F0562_012986 [Nyssa sinensis]|uniref:Growth-regulating factor n=1 Tax=Nyssa sinensis TaxID=561372 RepID=A0A5J4ZU48_9ASTE|nr:hypothetical protein F0562_012986 [Nyssa sinensis]
MDFLSFLLWFLFIGTLFQALLSIARGSKTIAKNLPPGPTPLPVIGNLLKLGNQPHKSLAELAKTHGPIMTLKLGQITTVVISSSTMAREVLQKQDLSFSNRSIPDALHAHNQSQLSVVWLPVATRWRNLRKILNSHIFSGQRLDAKQQLRCQKVKELIAYVQQSCQASVAVDIGRAVFRTSLNLLSNTMFSIDLADPSSDTAQEFKELVWSIMEEAGKPNLVDYFPVLRKLDPLGIRHRMTIHFAKMLGLFDRMINERLKIRKLQGCITSNDVLDILLNISENNSDEIDRTHIERMFLDLFAAGTDTTSSTLEWAMAELLHNPDTLLKAKAELEQILGRGSPPLPKIAEGHHVLNLLMLPLPKKMEPQNPPSKIARLSYHGTGTPTNCDNGLKMKSNGSMGGEGLATTDTAIDLGLELGSGYSHQQIGRQRKSGFTFLQLQELEHQALIYKYIEAGLPVPHHLIVPIWTSVATSFNALNGGMHHLYPNCCSPLHCDYRSNMDPEPGRCRRTDGKKWRCSKNVVPNHKYCERHMHRGRKHVQVSPFTTSRSNSTSTSNGVHSANTSLSISLSTS